MCPLLVRTFHAKGGRAPQLIAALQRAATRRIHAQEADAVLLCQPCNTGERILWIETRQGAAEALGLDESRELLECPSAVLPLEFLGGFCRLPTTSCEVWSLEVRTPAIRQAHTVRLLLGVARRASEDPNVVGFSLYRVVDDPTFVAGFLTLSPGIALQQYFTTQLASEAEAGAIESAVVWQPLVVTWSLRRLVSASGFLLSPTPDPLTIVWARALKDDGDRQARYLARLARA